MSSNDCEYKGTESLGWTHTNCVREKNPYKFSNCQQEYTIYTNEEVVGVISAKAYDYMTTNVPIELEDAKTLCENHICLENCYDTEFDTDPSNDVVGVRDENDRDDIIRDYYCLGFKWVSNSLTSTGTPTFYTRKGSTSSFSNNADYIWSFDQSESGAVIYPPWLDTTSSGVDYRQYFVRTGHPLNQQSQAGNVLPYSELGDDCSGESSEGPVCSYVGRTANELTKQGDFNNWYEQGTNYFSYFYKFIEREDGIRKGHDCPADKLQQTNLQKCQNCKWFWDDWGTCDAEDLDRFTSAGNSFAGLTRDGSVTAWGEHQNNQINKLFPLWQPYLIAGMVESSTLLSSALDNDIWSDTVPDAITLGSVGKPVFLTFKYNSIRRDEFNNQPGCTVIPKSKISDTDSPTAFGNFLSDDLTSCHAQLIVNFRKNSFGRMEMSGITVINGGKGYKVDDVLVLQFSQDLSCTEDYCKQDISYNSEGITADTEWFEGPGSYPEFSLNTNSVINVEKVVATEKAYAALKTDGSVFAWGVDEYGGSYGKYKDDGKFIEEGVVSGTLITDTSAEYHHMSMYGIKQMGRDPDTGASAEYEILGKGGSSPRISDIYSSNRAFAAKTEENGIISWGDPNFGGLTEVFEAHGKLNKIPNMLMNTLFQDPVGTKCVLSNSANYGTDQIPLPLLQSSPFSSGRNAKIKLQTNADGKVFHIEVVNSGQMYKIGDELYLECVTLDSQAGASCVQNYGVEECKMKFILGPDLTNVKDVYSNGDDIGGAFVATTHDNRLETWGYNNYGGGYKATHSASQEIQEIFSNKRAFVSLRTDGTIEAFGDNDYGGSLEGIEGGASGSLVIDSVIYDPTIPEYNIACTDTDMEIAMNKFLNEECHVIGYFTGASPATPDYTFNVAQAPKIGFINYPMNVPTTNFNWETACYKLEAGQYVNCGYTNDLNSVGVNAFITYDIDWVQPTPNPHPVLVQDISIKYMLATTQPVQHPPEIIK